VVAGLGAVTWKLARDTVQVTDMVARTYQVLNNLTQANGDAFQIELSTQNYRLHGDARRLAERDVAIAGREATLAEIKRLTADNIRQQQRWQELRAVIDQRITIAKKTEEIRKTQGVEAATAFVAGAPLKETREQMFLILGRMQTEELSLLASRTHEQHQARQFVVISGLLIALIFAIILTASFLLIRRQLKEAAEQRRALRESEESLSITLNSIGDAVLATDIHGLITRMNPVAERLTGWCINEVLGRPIDDVFRIISENTRMPAVVPVSEVLTTGKIHELANHTALIARDGSECPIADSAAPIRDNAGQLIGVVLVFRDETAARKAQRIITDQNLLLEQRVQERTAQLQQSEEHLRSLINNLPALIALVDTECRYVYVNQQYQECFAPDKAHITGCLVQEILSAECYLIAAPLIEKVLQGEAQSYDWQPSPDHWQVIHYLPRFDTDGQVIGYYVLGTEITERKHAEEKISLLNSQLSQHIHQLENVSRALKTLSAGNRTMLRAKDEHGLLQNMCTAIVEAGNYAMASVWYKEHDDFRSLKVMAEHGHLGGIHALQQLHGSWADNELGRGVIATAIRTGKTSVVKNILTDPAYVPWRAALPGYACGVGCPLLVNGEIIGGIVIYASEPNAFGADEVALLTDSADDLAFGISTLRTRAEQKQNQEDMIKLMRFDTLTGLPNETQFTELVKISIDTCKRNASNFALIQINVERLNEINVALGFSQGDQILRELAVRIARTVPESAMLARLRGDEFAILLPDSDINAAIRTIHRIEGQLATPFPIADIELEVSVKSGIAFFPAHGSNTHDLLRHMDIAVHHAKRKGVNYIVFDQAKNKDQSVRLNMAGQLRRAIENNELVLYLQPKIRMSDGQICGAEGLVRWRHPERGMIPPIDFIGLAEYTGLIKPLTEWVIEAALRLNHEWQQSQCAIPIAINLSTRNLREENLLENVRYLHSIWDVEPGMLEMEITESMVMDDPEFSLRILTSLREQGIPLYIDDFGTGYSSLSYLQKLPVDYIKIDQSFVAGMAVDHDSKLIVRSTIDLAHDLGRKVVAEGVETQADWDQLVAFGCDFAQGYFIAKPMPPELFQDWCKQYQPPSAG
jgi:diguanylate cyclase (GGDEF)-like protein/PAS domain S-box-containing protein